MSENNYVSCPSCDSTLLTESYKSRFGRCSSCYAREEVPLGVRIHRALR